jgi:hypothetical protein
MGSTEVTLLTGVASSLDHKPPLPGGGQLFTGFTGTMPSPMSGRTKELFGYKISDGTLFYIALAVFVGGTVAVKRMNGGTVSALSRAQRLKMQRVSPVEKKK